MSTLKISLLLEIASYPAVGSVIKNGKCAQDTKEIFTCAIHSSFSFCLHLHISEWRAPRIFMGFIGPWSGCRRSKVQHKFELCQTESHDQFLLKLLSTSGLHNYRNPLTTSGWFIPWNFYKKVSFLGMSLQTG